MRAGGRGPLAGHGTRRSNSGNRLSGQLMAGLLRTGSRRATRRVWLIAAAALYCQTAWGAGKNCTANWSAGTSQPVSTVTSWTGLNCSGNTTSRDFLTLGNHTLVIDQNTTVGNYGPPYFGYVSSVSPSGTSSDTTCASPNPAFSTCSGSCQPTVSGGSVMKPKIAATSNGSVVTTAAMNASNSNYPERPWVAGTAAGMLTGTLSGAMASGGSASISITLAASGSYANTVNGTYILVDPGLGTAEYLLITAGGGTTGLTVTRGQFGTALSAHSTNATIYIPGKSPAITDSGAGCTVATEYAVTFAAGGGPAGILFNNAGSTLQINSGITLTMAGWMYFSAVGKIVMKHGSHLTFDNSVAVPLPDGTYPIYGIGAYYQILVTLDISDCTNADPCTINGKPVGGTNNVLIQSGGAGSKFALAGPGVLNLSNLGGPMDFAIDAQNTWTAKFQLAAGSTVDHSGVVGLACVDGNCDIAYSASHTAPGSFSDLWLYGPAQPTGGHTRTITNSVFNGNLNAGGTGTSCGGSSNMAGVVFQNNYVAENWCALQAPNTFQYNFLRATGGGSYPALPIGNNSSILDSYFFLDGVTSNPHFAQTTAAGNSSLSFTGNVLDVSEDIGTNPAGDTTYVCPQSNPTVDISQTVANNTVLPPKQGNGNGWLMIDMDSCATNGHSKPYVNHNFWWGRPATNVQGAVSRNSSTLAAIDHLAVGSGGQTLASFASLKSNIVRGLGGSGSSTCDAGANCAFKMASISPALTLAQHYLDACTPTTCDYNVGYQFSLTSSACDTPTRCTNQGNGYSGRFSATPGPHDIDVVMGAGAAGINPLLADPTRNLATFHRAYLGLGAGEPQWQSGTVYANCGTATAPIVWDQHAGIYGNAVISYRCLVDHTASAATEPDAGATWRNGCGAKACWEYASLQDLRGRVAAGNVYNDGSIGCIGCGVVQALVNWVRFGFVSLNPLLWYAAWDGLPLGPGPANGPQLLPPATWVP